MPPVKMDGRCDTPSLLARLMGLDEPSPEQPVKKQKRQRVLSDTYLRRVASIGAWEKRSCNEFPSLSISIGESETLKDVSQMIAFGGGESRGRRSVGSLEDYLRTNDHGGFPRLQSGYVGISNSTSLPDLSHGKNETEIKLKSSHFCKEIVVLKPRPWKSGNDAKCLISTSYRGSHLCSWDCWRENSKGLPISRSISASAIGNLETRTRNRPLIMAPRFAVNRENQKSVKQSSSTNCINEINPSGQVYSASKLLISNVSRRLVCDKEADSKSSIAESSSQQEDELIEVNEDGYNSSQYSTDRDSLETFDATYQPSPVSVLETFNNEKEPGPNFFKSSTDASLHGLKLQLQILRSNSLDAEPESPGMVVSSDDDDDDDSEYESFDASSKENEAMSRLFRRVEESRDYSYMVDVLTEAGIRGKNHIGFEVWHSLDQPISPAIFGILEKKYGEQESWKRSERKLLFDRVNLGLIEMLQSSIGIPMETKPVTKRVRSWENVGGDYEEELWMLLVNQEKEARKESEKLLGSDDGWLVLGNDVEAISREIEDSLFDELAAEVVS